ncbi:MAG: hypothetical protein ACRD3C_19980 [Vicinamibacterales bacterium]
MAPFGLRRRRSDAPDFVQTELDIDGLAEEIFSRYAGEQRVVIDGTPSMATFFRRDYCPDLRVMKLAGWLALSINQHAALGHGTGDAVTPMRVTVLEVMLAALLHDLGKQHEDCAPFIELLEQTDLRGASGPDAARHKEYLLGIIRDVHCRKGPCMIDRLGDAGRPELSNPFIATVARRHGDDYEVNRCTKQGCWWASEINVVTIADDYDAMTSEGPERAYKVANISLDDAAALLWQGAERGRYERRVARIFIEDVLALDVPGDSDTPHQPTA